MFNLLCFSTNSMGTFFLLINVTSSRILNGTLLLNFLMKLMATFIPGGVGVKAAHIHGPFQK